MRLFVLLLTIFIATVADSYSLRGQLGRCIENFEYRGQPFQGLPNFAAFGSNVFDGVQDQCIVGSGASGMALAAFLKDLDQKVAVIEIDDVVGGYANTVHFTPPAPGLPSWVDIGASIFPNSTAANASGFGSWKLDTAAFVQRFAAGYAAGAVLPLTVVESSSELVDLAAGIDLGPSSAEPTPPSYEPTFLRFFETLLQYPWLNTGDWPDPLPAELLVPFPQWIATNNFELLYDSIFLGLGVSAGFGNLSAVLAITALSNMPPSILTYFTTNNTLFTVYNGVDQLYIGIANYLGTKNVLTNANILRVIRPLTSESSLPITLIIEVNNSLRTAFCKRLVVSHPQLLSNLNYLDLDQQEIDIFKYVSSYLYYTGAFTLSGGSLVNEAFQLTNLNPANPPYSFPVMPAIVNLERSFPYGPGVVSTDAAQPITDNAMLAVMQTQLAAIPALMSGINVTVYKPHTSFCPHFPASVLAKSPNVYTDIARLQGHRNTYWIGATEWFANSGLCWNQAYQFPSKYPSLLVR